MKKKEIQETVNNHFKSIEKAFHKTLIHFNIADIQQFRNEIKGFRSFLHLLDIEAGGNSQYKISTKMKTLYGYTGIIRNLHLLLHTINTNFEYSPDKFLRAFIPKLEKEITYWEKNTKEYVGQHKNFQTDEENIISSLPERLRRRSIKKFAGYLSFEIQMNLSRFNDEKLNNIRKFIEDLLYNWEYLNPFVDILPKGLQNKGELRSLAETLLDFRDKYAEYTILDTYYNDSEVDDEKVALANIMQFCKNQRDQLKSTIIARLEYIPVKPIVKRHFSL